jgi:hypothetical protein
LKYLAETRGIETVRSFAHNVTAAKHFSQIIKSIDSADSGRAAFNILAEVAALQIPSRKNAVMLEFDDAPMFMPILALVKKGRRDACKGALDFFWGESFGQEVLAKGGYLTPETVNWDRAHFHADWDELRHRDYREIFEPLTAEFGRISPAFDGRSQVTCPV